MLNKELLMMSTSNVGVLTVQVNWNLTTLLGTAQVDVYKNDQLTKTLKYPYSSSPTIALIEVSIGDIIELNTKAVRITHENLNGLQKTNTNTYLITATDCTLSLHVVTQA